MKKLTDWRGRDAKQTRDILFIAVWFLGFSAVLYGFLMLAEPARAADKRVPASRGDIELSFAPVVAASAPAVVNVYTRRVVRQPVSPFFSDPFFRQFFGDRESFGMPRERVQSSLGSGVIVREDGIIITNNHVIADGDEFKVALADRREFDAEVLLADERTDLAVLRIDPKSEKLPTLPFRDSDEAEVGDMVLAIGNPFGVGQTVTSGIVSALARTRVGISDFQFFIQTDAAINPGNSGGALVTMDGKLIGINTAIFSQSGGSIGIGFAIPANMVQVVIDSALGGGVVVRPWLGATGPAVTAEIAESINLDRPGGVILEQVYPGGPADNAGLKVGDVVRRVGSREILDPNGLRYRIATEKLNSTVQVGYVRKGVMGSTQVHLAALPEDPPRSLTSLTGQHPLAGAEVGNLSPAFSEELRLDPMSTGVVVASIKRGSTAHRLGVRPGDVILKVNGAAIASVGDLTEAVSMNRSQWDLELRRGDRIFTATVRG